MGNPALTPSERFSFRHYRSWPDSERWELIDGQAWAMSPAPKNRHQKLLLRLGRKFGAFLDGKPCEVYIAPFDILLPEDDEHNEDEIDTVVQPDLVVYCDRSKLTERGASGAPDLVVEILSPSTAKKDQNEKFRLYERHGVREYWVVDPEGRWLCVYRLIPALASTATRGVGGIVESGRRQRGNFDEGELRERLRDYSPVASKVLEGFSIDPEELFAGLEYDARP